MHYPDESDGKYATDPVYDKTMSYRLYLTVKCDDACLKQGVLTWQNGKGEEYIKALSHSDVNSALGGVVQNIDPNDPDCSEKDLNKFADVIKGVAGPLFSSYKCSAQCTLGLAKHKCPHAASAMTVTFYAVNFKSN